MSGQLITAVAGAAIGSVVPGVGTALGWTIGAAIGTLAFPPKQPDVIGPRIGDLRTQANQYGAAIGRTYGRVRKAGSLIWAAELREVEQSTEIGGKGAPSQRQTTYAYYASFAVMLADNEIVGVRRIWNTLTGELIYDASDTASVLDQAASNELAAAMTVYTGSSSQLPDPTMESYIGVGNVPAYRGRAYMTFSNLPLARYQNTIPQLTAEIIGAGSVAGLRREDYATSLYSQDTTTYGVAPVGVVVEDGVISFGLYHILEPVFKSQLNFSYDLDKLSQTGLAASKQYHGYIGHLGAYPVYMDDYTVSQHRRLMWGSVVLADNYYPNFAADSGALRGATVKDNHLYVILTDNYASNTVKMRAYTIDVLGALVLDGEADVSNFFDQTQSTFGIMMPPYSKPHTFAVEEDQQHIWFLWASDKVKYGVISDDYTITEIDTVTITPSNGWGIVNSGAHSGIFAAVSAATNDSGVQPNNSIGIYSRMDTVTANTVTLSSIVSDLCTSTNSDSEDALTASDIDVSALTDQVYGYAIAQQTSIRSAIEQLAQAYFFDAVESDGKIKFVKRGQASVVTIPDDDLAYTGSLDDIPYVAIDRQQEVEIPSSVALVYNDVDNGYQIGAQQSRRINVIAGGPLTVELPIALTATKAKQITDVLRIDATLARDKYTWATTHKYAKYEPTDVVNVGGVNVRITNKVQRPNGIIQWSGLLDDARNYDKSYAGATWSPPVQQVQPLPGPSHLVPLDINLLQDLQDGDFGFYAAVEGYLAGWSGAAVDKSADDGATYTRVANATQSATIGYAKTVLGAPATSYAVFDQANTVTVSMPTGYALTSVSEATLLANVQTNTVLIGNEIVRYTTATLSGNDYILSGLLRGMRGTESYASGHAIGDRVIALDQSKLERVALSQSEIGASRQYRTTSFGTYNGEIQTHTNNAIGQKPYAPVLLRAYKNTSNDIIINWVRRTRIGGSWENGADVPLGEAVESYSVDIYDSTYTTIKRTINSSTPTVTYTASQQTTDFGGLQTQVYVRVYQVSQYVGRGYVAQATITV